MLISIIVPLYNTITACGDEEYLINNIQSLINQTYKNIEIIYINNNSMDNSVEIIERFGAKDDRVKILEETQQGVGFARNCGIEHACGEYFTFVDADDYVALDYIETAVNELKSKPDILIRDFTCCDVKANRNFLSARSAGRKKYGNTITNYFAFIECVPNIFFNTGFINNLHIRQNGGLYIGEDNLFNTEAILNTKDIKISDNSSYFYQILPGSISRIRSDKYLDLIEAYDKMFELSLKHLGYINDASVRYFLGKYGYCMEKMLNRTSYRQECINLIEKYKQYFRIKKRSTNKLINRLLKSKLKKGISPEEISVIVQGSIDNEETPKCLKSIRKFLPYAEIILSTNKGADVRGLDYDVLVLSDDPGAILMSDKMQTYNNLNRQLVSTQEGLKKATGKYAMKLRSDMILTSDKFLDYFDKFQARSDKYNLFEHKILTSCLFSRLNLKSGKDQDRVPIPFHISDWWMFGLRDDLNKYFLDTQLIQEPYFSKYFDLEENKHKKNPFSEIKCRFTPEQYLCYSCFRRNFDDIYMEDAADVSEDIMQKSRECIANNFIILQYKQSGIYLSKYPYSRNEKFSGDQYLGLYNFWRYENEYKKYCDNSYKITTKDKFFENEELAYAKLRIYKHIQKAASKQTPFLKKLEHIFIGFPASSIGFLLKLFKQKKQAG